MGASLLIGLRDGTEASLVVAIVLAFVKRSDRPEMSRWVWLGAASAAVVAGVVGVILHFTLDGLEGTARTRTFAATCVLAAGLLTWMIFWMRSNARHLKGDWEGKAAQAIAHSAQALFFLAFVAVIREGVEAALLLLSTATSDSGTDVVVGVVIGLLLAVAVGALIYKGSHLINLRRFFQVTGVLVIALAAGLLSKAVLFIQGQTVNVVYNVNGIRWLTDETQVGKFLIGIFGWDPAPSVLQFVVYLGYLVPAVVFFFWDRPKKPVAAKPATAEGTTRAPDSRSLAGTH